MKPLSMEMLAPMGRTLIALSFLAFGIEHFVYREFVTRAMPAWPPWIPGRSFWPYVIGLILMVGSVAILTGKCARIAALFMGAMILASAILIHVPMALANPPMWGALWTNVGKSIALSAGAGLVAATLPASPPHGWDASLIRFGRYALGTFMIFCGIEHFIFTHYVALLIPPWIPSSVFWTCSAGVALIAGGAGIALRVFAPWPAALSGVMILLWVPLLHLPRAFADRHSSNEWTAVFEALAMSGIAFLMTTSVFRKSRE